MENHGENVRPDFATEQTQARVAAIFLSHCIDDKQAEIERLQAELAGLKLAYGIATEQDIQRPNRERKPTQKEFIYFLAKQNGGTVTVKEATRLMIESGIAKGQVKYVYGHVTQRLRDDERYERVAPGQYRLRQQIGLLEAANS